MITIIPAIDLIAGQCVRLSQGNFDRSTVYAADPVVMAQQFAEAGIRRLHLVDLDGARTGSVKQIDVLEKIAAATDLVIDFSGGIKSVADLNRVFSAGAAIAGIGSFAVRQPDTFLEWMDLFGSEKILLGADVRDEKLALKGWTEQSNIPLIDFVIPLYQQGMRHLFCTDISADGMLQGTATDLYKELLHQFPDLQLIASGGTASIQDIEALEAAGCTGVIIGKAIYEGLITLNDLKKFSA